MHVRDGSVIKLVQTLQATHARLGNHSFCASFAIPHDVIQQIVDTPRARDRQCQTDCRRDGRVCRNVVLFPEECCPCRL